MRYDRGSQNQDLHGRLRTIASRLRDEAVMHAQGRGAYLGMLASPLHI